METQLELDEGSPKSSATRVIPEDINNRFFQVLLSEGIIDYYVDRHFDNLSQSIIQAKNNGDYQTVYLLEDEVIAKIENTIPEDGQKDPMEMVLLEGVLRKFDRDQAATTEENTSGREAEEQQEEKIQDTDSNELTIGELEDIANLSLQNFERVIQQRSDAGVCINVEEYRELAEDYADKAIAAINARHVDDDNGNPAYEEEISSLSKQLEKLRYMSGISNAVFLSNASETQPENSQVNDATDVDEATQTDILPVPVAKPSPTTKRFLLTGWYIKTRERAYDYFNDPEKGFRRRTIRTLGEVAIIAAAAYAISKGLGDGTEHAIHLPHLPVPKPSAPAPTTPPLTLPHPSTYPSNAQLHEYTWSLADHYSPKNPNSAINTILGIYNKRFKTHFKLIPFNGNEEIGQRVRGYIRIINPAQMLQLNKLLVKWFSE